MLSFQTTAPCPFSGLFCASVRRLLLGAHAGHTQPLVCAPHRQRHTAIALTIVVAGLIYTALYIHDDNELTNRRRWGSDGRTGVVAGPPSVSTSLSPSINSGVLGMVVIFLTIAAVQLADGPFFRPHPSTFPAGGDALASPCSFFFLVISSVPQLCGVLSWA